jgi:AraC-like DNA-binding protein
MLAEMEFDMMVPFFPPDIADVIDELKLELDHNKVRGHEHSSNQIGVNRCKIKQSLTRMCFGVPTIMLTVRGQKHVTMGDSIFKLVPGDMLILPEAVNFDVENIPDTREGRYLGLAIRFDAEILTAFRDLYGAQFDNWDLTPRWHVKGNARITAAIANWVSWVRRFPPDQIQTRHRMIEMMLLFADQGIAGNLIFKLHRSWRHRLKQLLLLDPARNWRMTEICRRLGVSESTLRRHLHEENIGFRAILEEVRLEHGMGLIMSSDMLIGQVSLSCGYQSQSRFAERFKMRFSMSPIELRNSRNEVNKGILLSPGN